jgi:hypothetical protein
MAIILSTVQMNIHLRLNIGRLKKKKRFQLLLNMAFGRISAEKHIFWGNFRYLLINLTTYTLTHFFISPPLRQPGKKIGISAVA